MIKNITQYVKNNTTGFTIGTNLFSGFIPSTAQNDAVVLRDSGGLPNFYLVDKVEVAIQVLSRASDYWVARANAMKVFDCLHGIAGVTLPIIDSITYYVTTAEAITAPQNLGQDEKGLFNISTNYTIRIKSV
jgi:hypothetical protein